MNKYILIFLIFSSIVSSEEDTQKIISNDEMNNALQRLYFEIACPATYHIQKTPYPYVYCIDEISYKDEKILFKFNVFENFSLILTGENKGARKEEFKELLKLIVWNLGISFNLTQPDNIYGVIDRLHLSNINKVNDKDSKKIKRWMKNNSIIYLVNYQDEQWYQAVLGLNKGFNYSVGKTPKPLEKLFSKK